MHSLSDAQNLALHYAKFADSRNFAAMGDIISENFSQKGPYWECQGADAFLEQLQVLERDYSTTLHMVGNQLGQWFDDYYEGETYSIASHIYEKDGVARKLDMAVCYLERVEYIDGRYRYTRRDLEIIWTSDQPLNS